MSFYSDFKQKFDNGNYKYKSGNVELGSKTAVGFINQGKVVNAVSADGNYLKLSDVSGKFDDFSETFVSRVKDEKYNVTFVTEKSDTEPYAHTEYVRLSVKYDEFLKMCSNSLGVSLTNKQLLDLTLKLKSRYPDIFTYRIACYYRIDTGRVYFDERIIRIVRDVMNELNLFEVTQNIDDVAINAWKQYSASEIEDPRKTFERLVGNQLDSVLQFPGMVRQIMGSKEVSDSIYLGGITSIRMEIISETLEPPEVPNDIDSYAGNTYKIIALVIYSTSQTYGYVSKAVNSKTYSYFPFFDNYGDAYNNCKRTLLSFYVGREKGTENYKISSYIDGPSTAMVISGPTSFGGKENVYTPDATYAPGISLKTSSLYFSLSVEIEARTGLAEIFNLFKSPESTKFGNSVLPGDFTGSVLDDPNFANWAAGAKTLEVYTNNSSKEINLLAIAKAYVDQNGAWTNTDEITDDDVEEGSNTTEEEGGDIDTSKVEVDKGTTDETNDFMNEDFSGYFMNTYFVDDANLAKFSTFLNDKSIWESVVTALKGDNTDSLISIHVLPVTPEVSPTAEHIKMGPFEISYANGKSITNRFLEKDFGALQIDKYFNDARDYTMTKFRLFLPFFGFVDLDAYDLIESTVKLSARIDVYTGDGVYFVDIERGNMSSQMYSYQFNCKLDIPFSSAKKDIGSALVGMGGAMMMSIATENPAPMIAAGVSGAMQAAKQEFRHSSNYNSNVGFMGIMRPYFIVNRPVNGEAFDFANFQGVATNKTVYLKNLKGFTKVKEIHLENMGYATSEEIAEIEEALKRGVIF